MELRTNNPLQFRLYVANFVRKMLDNILYAVNMSDLSR
jgi:hypothetical protein